MGDLIDLHSFIDTSTRHQPAHQYEVVQVVHRLYDVTDKQPEGYHFVTVFVKPSQSALFSRSTK